MLVQGACVECFYVHIRALIEFLGGQRVAGEGLLSCTSARNGPRTTRLPIHGSM